MSIFAMPLDFDGRCAVCRERLNPGDHYRILPEPPNPDCRHSVVHANEQGDAVRCSPIEPSRDGIFRFAHLSLDERYRYTLERHFDRDKSGRLALFVMLNPSTADASKDDATIRKCMGFARRWGLSGIRVVNLYAFRATNPQELETAPDPVGDPDNYEAIYKSVAGGDVANIVMAWGAWPGPLPGRTKRVTDILIEARGPSRDAAPIQALALTKLGQPRHPLYMPYGKTPVAFYPEV